MKYLCIVLVLAMLLSGCTQASLETVADEIVNNPPASGQISVNVPDEASVFTMENGHSDKLYVCDGYTISLHTLSGGDLNKTFREVTGYSEDALAVIHTKHGDLDRYDAVWASVGETGDQLGRVAVIDDGYYHYVLTAVGDAKFMGENGDKLDAVFSSLTLENAA